MKVAFLISSFPTISETFILNQIAGFIDNDIEVVIYASKNNNLKKEHADIPKYKLKELVNYTHQSIGIINSTLELLKKLMYGFIKYPVKTVKSLNFIKYGISVFNFKLFYYTIAFLNSETDFDFVIAHFGPNGLIAAQLKVNKVISSKVGVFFHGFDLSNYLCNKKENIYDLVFKTASIILPISNYWKKKLIEMGCPENKIHVHHMGINPDKFTYKKRIYNNKLNLITVARFVEKKGIRYALKALKGLKIDGYCNFKYIIVGDGPLRKKHEAYVHENGLIKKITFTGWASKEKVLALLEKQDILLAPSCQAKDGDMEGIPVSIMEAMAKGLIVISTKHSGIPELVTDQESGILLEERNSKQITRALKSLIENKSLWEDLSLNARKKIIESFNIKKLNLRLIELLNNNI